jgi:hypothetical protein
VPHLPPAAPAGPILATVPKTSRVPVLLCCAGARMTRSKQRELESLRAQHEDMVATMQETAARRDAASKQLISHYKGEFPHS